MNWLKLIQLVLEIITNLPFASDEQISQQTKVTLRQMADESPDGKVFAQPVSIWEEIIPHIIAIVRAILASRGYTK